MTECEIQILITNNNKHEKHKQKPDQTRKRISSLKMVLLSIPEFFCELLVAIENIEFIIMEFGLIDLYSYSFYVLI